MTSILVLVNQRRRVGILARRRHISIHHVTFIDSTSFRTNIEPPKITRAIPT